MNKQLFFNRIFLTVLLLCGVLSIQGQRRSSFRLGLNYPISFAEYAQEVSRVGLTIGWERQWKDRPYAWGVDLSYQDYAKYSKSKLNGREVEHAYPDDCLSISLTPYANYYWTRSKQFSSFVGLSAGASLDNGERPADGSAAKPVLRAVMAPRCGITLFNHMEMALQYYLSYDYRSRAIFSLSYKF